MTSFKGFRLATAVAALCIAAASAAYPNGSGSGKTTRYWDCCKPSCAWSENVNTANGNYVRSCSADSNGNATIDKSTQSGCNGGSSYVCSDQQPFISNGKAYAFAAANVNNVPMKDMCCACYELTFTNTALQNSVLTIQVVNTGSDLASNQFDLQYPGGGMGIFTAGCPKEFPGTPAANWGRQYGGVESRAACSGLPSVLVEGCQFYFDWFKGADNPTVNFNRVACPAELTDKSGCRRSDDGPAPAPSTPKKAATPAKKQVAAKKPAAKTPTTHNKPAAKRPTTHNKPAAKRPTTHNKPAAKKPTAHKKTASKKQPTHKKQNKKQQTNHHKTSHKKNKRSHSHHQHHHADKKVEKKH